MKKQAFNPFLPSYEYVPDGEPYVFGDRVYIYGSHDKYNGEEFCMNNYVCWSAHIDSLGDWRYEGVIYSKNQDPFNSDSSLCMYAPDIVKGQDGRFYLYYTLAMNGIMSVAVSNSCAGSFEFYGYVKYKDGSLVGQKEGDVYQFDPGVFIDDDGRIYLYTGFSPMKRPGHDNGDMENKVFKGRLHEGAYCLELEEDMLTVKLMPKLITAKTNDSSATDFEGHEFFEASSIRKINNKYYFVYSSVNAHELCYAVSDYPDHGFGFKGTIVSNGDVFLNGRERKNCLNYMGNNHGGLVLIKGQWYIFYHRHTNLHSFSRQACAEPIVINVDGSINQVEITSCGLNGGALLGVGKYDAHIACNLYSKNGAGYIDWAKTNGNHPYFTQSGKDRENDGEQYIANMLDGATAGFKYFAFADADIVAVEVRGTGTGKIHILNADSSKMFAIIDVEPCENFKTFCATFNCVNCCDALFFSYVGDGYIDFKAFELLKQNNNKVGA